MTRFFRRLTGPRSERGALGPMAAILIVMILALSALVLDGSRALNARGAAASYAQEAARAAVSGIDQTKQEPTLVAADADQRVATFCQRLQSVAPGVTCTPDVTATTVQVTVHLPVKPTFGGAFGLGNLNQSAVGYASVDQGITQAHQDAPKLLNPVKDPVIDDPPPVGQPPTINNCASVDLLPDGTLIYFPDACTFPPDCPKTPNSQAGCPEVVKVDAPVCQQIVVVAGQVIPYPPLCHQPPDCPDQASQAGTPVPDGCPQFTVLTQPPQNCPQPPACPNPYPVGCQPIANCPPAQTGGGSKGGNSGTDSGDGGTQEHHSAATSGNKRGGGSDTRATG